MKFFIGKKRSADEPPASSSSSVNINSFVENADQASNEEPAADINSSHAPASILPFRKASPGKKSNRRSGKTKIYTDTPVRDKIEKRSLEKKNQSRL